MGLKEEAVNNHNLEPKSDQECQVEISQRDAKMAWARVGELEESLRKLQDRPSKPKQFSNDGAQVEDMKSKLVSVKESLAERDEQLAESRKGIAEAQKMTFRLMNTVQELRKKAKS